MVAHKGCRAAGSVGCVVYYLSVFASFLAPGGIGGGPVRGRTVEP